MLDALGQPLAYAERLLGAFAALARASSACALLDDFARRVCQLCGCELAQVYLLDAGAPQLSLATEVCRDIVPAPREKGVAGDYRSEQLLEFCLCQNRVISLDTLTEGLYQTGFLPDNTDAWRTLLGVPLCNREGVVEGLLICASVQPLTLSGYAPSLRALGAFVLVLRALLAKVNVQNVAAVAVTEDQACARGYGLIGSSAAMNDVCRLLGRVMHSRCTVLLTGETGTGKEVIARVLHDRGPRRAKKFVVQNCAAFPVDLLESELFGHRKGAFTGADRDHRGLFDIAHGGTLLLDEVGDMPLALQAKLLRVLQEREIRPLGASEPHRVDVRIIAATHRDLPAMVAQGTFREDLYYRLAQFPVQLPPLRQREADVLELARHFARQACAAAGRDALGWSQETLTQLAVHAFPGNVRELKGRVERAVLMCDGATLLPEHFSLRTPDKLEQNPLNLRQHLDRVERAYMLACLRRNGGNQTVAARELGLPRRTLLYRLGRLNVDLRAVQT